jgi:hypothetical protein
MGIIDYGFAKTSIMGLILTNQVGSKPYASGLAQIQSTSPALSPACMYVVGTGMSGNQ